MNYYIWALKTICFSAGPIPLRVREAEIPIVSDAECIRKINAVTEKIFILPASSFCAGGEEGNDACQVSNTTCIIGPHKGRKLMVKVKDSLHVIIRLHINEYVVFKVCIFQLILLCIHI